MQFHRFFTIFTYFLGKLKGRVGVFPSNFVEMIKTGTSGTTTGQSANEDDQTVADKNKRNEKLKGT